MSKESTGSNSSRLDQLLTLADTLEATPASSVSSLLPHRPLPSSQQAELDTIKHAKTKRVHHLLATFDERNILLKDLKRTQISTR
jgi:hypothetical protein